MIDVLFLTASLFLFFLLGRPFCTVLPEAMVQNRLLAAPVLGLGLFGMAVTVLYRWGLSPGEAGAVVAGLGLLSALRHPCKLFPHADGWNVLLSVAAVGLLCLLPKWTGGPQFWVFQGNDQDQINYLAYSSAIRFRTYADLMALTPATAMENDYLLGAQSMLKARPTVCISFAALTAMTGLPTGTVAYAYQVLMQMGMLFAAAFTARNALGASQKASLWGGAGLSLGFYVQYIFDINAWSELATLPMVMVGMTALIILLDEKASKLNRFYTLSMVIGITCAAIIYFYPEALMEFGFPLSALLLVLFCRGEAHDRLGPMLAGLAGAFLIALPLLHETIALLLHMGNAAAFKSMEWWTYFQRYLFGRDIDYFAPIVAADTPLTVLYALLSLPVDFLAGLMGLHFALPLPDLPIGLRAVWKFGLAIGMSALLRNVIQSIRRERSGTRRGHFYFLALTSLMMPAAIAIAGRFWSAGKALSMASPLLFLVLASPILLSTAAGRGARLLAAGYVLVHLGLGGYRPLAAMAPSGIHYRMPYPGVPDPTYKTKLSWDILQRREDFAECHNVSLDISHPVLERYVQMVLSEWGVTWSSLRPLNSYYGNGIDLGLQPQPAFADCLATTRLVTAKPGQSVIWLGRDNPLRDFHQGVTDSMDLVDLSSDTAHMSGWHDIENYQGEKLRWTDGSARITLEQSPLKPIRTIRLVLWPVRQPESKLRLRINGKILFDAPLADGGVDMVFRLEDAVDAPSFEIVMESGSFSPPQDSRKLGLAIRHLILSH